MSWNHPRKNHECFLCLYAVYKCFASEKGNCALFKWSQEQRINSLWLRELRSNIKQRLDLQKCHSFTIQRTRLGQSLSKSIQGRWRDCNNGCCHLSCLLKALRALRVVQELRGKGQSHGRAEKRVTLGHFIHCKCLPDQKLHRIPGEPVSSKPCNAYLMLPHLLVFVVWAVSQCPKEGCERGHL